MASTHLITCTRVRELLAQSAVPGDATEHHPVLGPWDERLLFELPLASPDMLPGIEARARKAQQDWACEPFSVRVAVLRQLANLLLEREPEALDVIQLESGKSRLDAHEELLDVVLTASFTARRAARLLRESHAAGALPGLTRTRVGYRPHGVVGIIAPWNYPLTLALSDALPALAAGNAVILKPAEQTSLTALWCREQLRRSGLPEGLFQVVPGRGPEVGAALLEHVDFLQFTGSSSTGRHLAGRTGERLLPASLELGGKNAMLVLEDADPRRAARTAVRACFANAGQLCVSVERVFVHARRYDSFLRHFRREVEALRIGRGFTFENDMGSLIDRAQREKVQGHVEDAVARGAAVITGGHPLPDLGPAFFAPTVLTGVDGGMLVHQDETFGPVVSVAPVERDADALTRANEGEFGLHAVVMTGNIARGRCIAERIRAGSVSINDGYSATWGSAAAPQGGVGASGLGRRHGDEGIRKYVRSQTVAASLLHPIRAPRGIGNGVYARALTAAVRLLTRLGIR